MITSPRPSRLFPLAVFFLLSASVVGCGRGASDLALPTAPSGLTAPLSSVSDSDEASGIELTDAPDAALSTVAEASAAETSAIDGAHDAAPAGLQVFLEDATFKVRGEGVVTALVPGTACPALTFRIDEHTIKTNSKTHYGALDGTNSTDYGSGACADIVVGAKVYIEAITQPDGSFLAQSIRVKAKPKPKKFRGEGVVTSVVATTACPTLTFKIGEHTIRTDNATVYEGGKCIEIVVGAKLDVEVTDPAGATLEVEPTNGTGTGGTLLALCVRFKSKPKTEKFEKEGLITAINPTTRMMTVESRQILVPTTAIIRHGDKTVAFADLKVGDRVHVRGFKNLDGYVAELVLVQQKSVGGGSVVSSLVAGTACPKLEFVVVGVRVHTDTDTEFKGGVCADIKPGLLVEVKGYLEPEGVHASRIEIKK